MTLTPVFNEKLKLIRALNQVAEENRREADFNDEPVCDNYNIVPCAGNAGQNTKTEVL